MNSEIKDVEEFTIHRSEWGDGETLDDIKESGAPFDQYASLLLNPVSKKKCCMGIYCCACGVPENVLADAMYPANLDEPYRSALPDWLFADKEHRTPSEAAMCLARINDTVLVTPETREKEIVRIFSEHGVKVYFSD